MRFINRISLKLFVTFWLVIISSVTISSFLTTQFTHTPTQQAPDAEQLALLEQFSQQVNQRNKRKIMELQRKFFKQYQQHLIVKKYNNNKIFTPRNRVWSKIRNYLKKHPTENPVTIDFSFTQITSYYPLYVNNQKYQLFVATPIDQEKLIGWIKQLPLTIRLLMLLTISFACCWLLAKSFTKPLLALNRASNEIGNGNLGTRIKKYDQRSDEFGTLSKSFNKMAEQLETNITAHKRLLADVSHELRSPLTRMQLAIALIEKNINSPAEQEKHIARCEMEADRLEDMIEDVLTLSRLEHNHKTLTLVPSELNKVIKHCIQDCQYLADDKNVSIKLDAPETILMSLDDKLLSSAMNNIIINAIKYSPEHKSVCVNITNNDGAVHLSIEDQGPGVPEEKLNELFKPFFRVGNARDRATGGTGLGLAIAQQAVELHKGSISATNIVGEGLCVDIMLPINLKPHA